MHFAVVHVYCRLCAATAHFVSEKELEIFVLFPVFLHEFVCLPVLVRNYPACLQRPKKICLRVPQPSRDLNPSILYNVKTKRSYKATKRKEIRL